MKENNVIIPSSVFKEMMDTLATMQWGVVANLMTKIQTTVTISDNTNDIDNISDNAVPAKGDTENNK